MSADATGLQGRAWLVAQWAVACPLASQAATCVLVLGEIQKVADLTEEVKPRGMKTRQRPDIWGRLVESAVGVALLARHLTHNNRHPSIHYWNNGLREVDYVLTAGQDIWALEFRSRHNLCVRTDAFVDQFPAARPLILETGGVFLGAWLQGV